jgi:hypothetical protein
MTSWTKTISMAHDTAQAPSTSTSRSHFTSGSGNMRWWQWQLGRVGEQAVWLLELEQELELSMVLRTAGDQHSHELHHLSAHLHALLIGNPDGYWKAPTC